MMEVVNIRQISPELAAKARSELNEVESRIPDDISTLRSWIKKQPHLKSRTDDQFLLTFLRGSKYSLEKVKHKIDYYYTIKSLSPNLFLYKTVDDKVLRLTKCRAHTPLINLSKTGGPRVTITKFDAIEPSDFSLTDLLKYQLRILDIEIQEDDNCSIAGIISVVDFSNVPFGYVYQFDPVLVKKFVIFIDKAIPFRIKGIHLINTPKEAITLINITRGLMPKKLTERLTVDASFESLYNYISKDDLPEEYGGNNGRLQDSVDYWSNKMYEYKGFFEEDLQYGVKEKLRIGKKITTESLFGLEGSFRKLEVD